MKTKSLRLICYSFLLFTLSGCLGDLKLEGNGISASEERHTGNFQEVISTGSFIVNIAEGENCKVIVTAESNLLPYITTRVSSGKLEIGVRGIHILDPSLPVIVDIVMPSLTSVTLSGSGEINTGHFSVAHFEILESGSGVIRTDVESETTKLTLSGSGTISLEGNTSRCDFLISGSGVVSAYNFQTSECHATVSGSGHMYINTSDLLNVNISGSGTIYYKGNPLVYSNISGSGKVIHTDGSSR